MKAEDNRGNSNFQRSPRLATGAARAAKRLQARAARRDQGWWAPGITGERVRAGGARAPGAAGSVPASHANASPPGTCRGLPQEGPAPRSAERGAGGSGVARLLWDHDVMSMSPRKQETAAAPRGTGRAELTAGNAADRPSGPRGSLTRAQTQF